MQPRLKGFDLSIDDLGTRFSSLVKLHRMPFSELKVDRSFVSETVRDAESRVIVQSVIGMAHNMGLCASVPKASRTRGHLTF